MHRGKQRIPTHRFPVDSIPGAFGTGYAKDGEPVDVDECRMRGYPQEVRLGKPRPDPAILRRIMREARLLKRRAEARCR